jgi:hypothetical protein
MSNCPVAHGWCQVSRPLVRAQLPRVAARLRVQEPCDHALEASGSCPVLRVGVWSGWLMTGCVPLRCSIRSDRSQFRSTDWSRVGSVTWRNDRRNLRVLQIQTSAESGGEAVEVAWVTVWFDALVVIVTFVATLIVRAVPG